MALSDALTYLKTNGWYKGATYGPGESACALGACQKVGVNWKDTVILDDVAAEQFEDRMSDKNGLRPIALLNDHRDTTFEDIEMVFQKAQMRQSESAEFDA